jgi:hypothetical protein
VLGRRDEGPAQIEGLGEAVFLLSRMAQGIDQLVRASRQGGGWIESLPPPPAQTGLIGPFGDPGAAEGYPASSPSVDVDNRRGAGGAGGWGYGSRYDRVAPLTAGGRLRGPGGNFYEPGR